jgi:hypothetical protein
MASFRIHGDEVVSAADFYGRLASGLEGLDAETLETHPLAAALETPQAVATAPGVTQFVPVGLGKPLTVLIRHVYTGRHPVKTTFGSAKHMAVVTGLKDYSVYAASTRAVNYLMKDAKPKTPFKAPPTFTDGTNVVAYSPAVLTDSLTFTVEMAFDRFPDGLFNAISKGLSGAGGIPVMIPAQGYLLAASSLVRIFSDWADALIDGKASFSITDTLDFNIPGVAPPAADFRVLCNFDAAGMTYDPAQGLMQNGTAYRGDEPYVVISLDGAERKNLEGFAPTAASASVLKQFFNMRDGSEASIEAIMAGMKLVNDLKFREEAQKLERAVEKATGEDKAKLQKRLDAVVKNILSEELRPG